MQASKFVLIHAVRQCGVRKRARWFSGITGDKSDPKEAVAFCDGLEPYGLGDHHQHLPALCNALLVASSSPSQLL